MAKPKSSLRKNRKSAAQTAARTTVNPAAFRRVADFFLKPATWPVWLFLVCFGAYTINGDPFYGNDQKSNMIISVNLLKNHSFAVTPKQAPQEFFWVLQEPGAEGKWARIHRWDPETTALYESGKIKPHPPYYLVESRRPGHYVSVFGAGAALTALPFYALLNLFGDVAANHYLWWHGAKLLAAALVALASVLIFLSLRRFVSPGLALFGALAFGLGSCAWSISSQGLWQQTPHLFFLALGAWFLFGSAERKNFSLYCGAALGMAVLCRPTGVFAALCVGLYFVVVARRDALKYVLGALPFAAAVYLYNDYYFGSPFTFAQGVAAESLAAKSGEPGGMWRTPVVHGLGGLLFSPSRGLLFYSPLLLLGFAGVVMQWRMLWKEPRKFSSLAGLAPLIPLQIAAVAMLITAAKWFDWWGGAAYGPRPIVDAGVFLALSLIPVLDKAFAMRWARALLVVLLVYSATVQTIGAWSYNGLQWNQKDGMDPGQPDHRGRFWSLSDSQILYYAVNFKPARAEKRRITATVLSKTVPVVIGP